MKYYFSEIFNEIRAAKRKYDKVALLVKYGSIHDNQPFARAFQALLVANYHPGVIFDTPVPNYKEDEIPVEFGRNSLYDIIGRLYIFQDPKGSIKDVWRPQNPKITFVSPDKKRTLLKEMLQDLPKDEASVLVNILFKNLEKAYGIKEDLVREAFPGLLPEKTV